MLAPTAGALPCPARHVDKELVDVCFVKRVFLNVKALPAALDPGVSDEPVHIFLFLAAGGMAAT